MKEKLKLLIREYIEIGGGIVMIIAFFFDYGDRFKKIHIELNIIQILLLLGIVGIAIKILLDINKKSTKELRAENFYRNWCKYKNILEKHKNGEKNLELIFNKYKSKLLKDISYFMKDFVEIRTIKDGKYNGALPEYRNLRKCTEYKELDNIDVRIPEDFDIFDNMILELTSLK